MQNRREFLITSLALAAGCTTAPRESGGILDTHTHFYDPTRPQGVPWPPKDDALLYRKVMPEELKKMALPLGITGTIVVEASPWVEDNQWILDLAKTDTFIKGLVGHLKPGRPGFSQDLNRSGANPLFRGIRVGLWDIPLATEDSTFVNDLRLLAKRGLTLDVLGGPDQIEKIASLATAIPDLRIVVDHCAGVRVTGEAPDAKWVNGIKLLAARRNIHMKVSGLVEGTGFPNSAPLSVESYRPALDVLWNSFGEDRVLFGSNWPVSARFASYENVLKIVRDYVKSGTAAEKYFRRNAERVYLS
jgi:L-fuconolactonase